MDILGYTIFVLIFIAGLPLLLFALRHGEDNADKTQEEKNRLTFTFIISLVYKKNKIVNIQ